MVSKTRTVAEWWAKLFSPSYRQWRELFCHFVTKPNLSDCIIFLSFFGNMHCLLSKNFFEPQEKNVSYETRTLQWKVWFTTVILIFFYCSSLVAIWPQCHALYEKPLFERWFICVCVFFSFFFFWVLPSFEQSLTDSWYDFRQTLVVNEDQQCQKTGTEVNTHFDAFLFVFCGLVWVIDVLVIIDV